MSEGIIVAVLSFLGTTIGSLIGILQSNKLTNYKIEELQKKVEKHNSVIERTTILEEKVSEIEDNIREIKEKIEK